MVIVPFYLGDLHEERFSKYLLKLNDLDYPVSVVMIGGNAGLFTKYASQLSAKINCYYTSMDLAPFESKLLCIKLFHTLEVEVGFLVEDDFIFGSNMWFDLKLVEKKIAGTKYVGKLQHIDRAQWRENKFEKYEIFTDIDSLSKVKSTEDRHIKVPENLLDTRDGFILNRKVNLLSLFMSNIKLKACIDDLDGVLKHDDHLISQVMYTQPFKLCKTATLKHDLDKYLVDSQEDVVGTYTTEAYESNTIFSKLIQNEGDTVKFIKEIVKRVKTINLSEYGQIAD